MGTWHNDSVGFYSRMNELQDKLRKSEVERLKLEQKFNSLSRSCEAEESARLNTFRENYSKVLKEDRMRCDRNETIMQTLERIESRASMLTAKTDRLRLLRKHYEAYMTRLYPDWKKDNDEIQNPNIKQFQPNNSYLGSSPLYQSNSTPVRNMYKVPQSTPATRKSSIIFSDTNRFSDTSRRMSLASNPAIILTEPPRSTTESPVLRNLEISHQFTPKNLFSPSIPSDITKLNTTEFSPYYKDQFKSESVTPSIPLYQKHNKPTIYNDADGNFVSDNINRNIYLDRDQNTSGDLLSMSLSDDSIIKDIPKDTKPDYSFNSSKYQTNRLDHLAKAPTFGNKLSLDKTYTRSSEFSSPLNPTLRKSLSRTTSFDMLSKYGQDKNKYGYPSISRKQSLSSDNLDLRSEDLYKPRSSAVDRALNFGKYSSSINSDDYVFKKYLVQPNTQIDSSKYDDKYKPSSQIYLPGRNLLERKSSVDYTNPYGTKFDSREFQGLHLPYKSVDKPSYLERERQYPSDKTIHFENERKYRPSDSLNYQRNESLRNPYYYQTDNGDMLDYNYKTQNPMTETSTLYKDKPYFDGNINDRKFEENEFKIDVFSKNNSFGKINEELNPFEEKPQLGQYKREKFSEETINPLESEISKTQNHRQAMLPDEMVSLTEKLNQSVKGYLNPNDNTKSVDKKKVSYDFSETNPNILSATPSFQEQFSENINSKTQDSYVDRSLELPKKEFTRSTEENILKSFPKIVTNKITEECDEDGVDYVDKLKVKFELSSKNENFEQNEEVEQLKNLKDQFNLTENKGDILQNNVTTTNDDISTSTNIKSADSSSVQFLNHDKPSSIEESKDVENVSSVDVNKNPSDDVSSNVKLNDNVIERNENIKKIEVNNVIEEKTASLSTPKENLVNTFKENAQHKDEISKPSKELIDNVQVKQNLEKDLSIIDNSTVNIPSTEKNKLNINNKEESLKTPKYDETDNEIGVLKKGVSDVEKHQENIKEKHDSSFISDKEINESAIEEYQKHEAVDQNIGGIDSNKILEMKNLNENLQINDKNEHIVEKNDQDQQEYEKQFAAGTEEKDEQQYYEHNIHETENQQYYSNDIKSDDHPVQYYDGGVEKVGDQQYYEDDNQQIDQTKYDDNKLYYEDNNHHPDRDQTVNEGMTQNSADQQYYEEQPQHYYGDQENTDGQQYYEGDPQYSVDQQYYEGKSQVDQSKVYYEGTSENVDSQNIVHPVDPQLYNETMNVDSNQYYEQTPNKDGVEFQTDRQPYQGDISDQQVYDSENIDQQYHDGNVMHADDQQYYEGKMQNIDGQYVTGDVQQTENEQYYAGNVENVADESYHQGGEHHPSNKQYYEENPAESQYYGKPDDQNYPQEPYDNQQYYDQYAEGGVPVDYNPKQQYAEGENYPEEGVPVDYNPEQQYGEGGNYPGGRVPVDYNSEQQYAEGENYPEEGVPVDYNPEQQYGEGGNYPEGGVPVDYNPDQQYAEGGNYPKEGVPVDYNPGQQYVEGENYSYNYDKAYPEGYEQYQQDGHQYPEQYDTGNEYNYPEAGIEGSGTLEYNMAEHSQDTVEAEDISYIPSQDQSAPNQEELDQRFDQQEEHPVQQQDVSDASPLPVVASKDFQKPTKKQTSLHKVLDSDSDSINLGAGQNMNDDSSDFDFSSEKK